MKEIKQSYKDIAEIIYEDPEGAEDHLNQIKDSMATVRNFYKLYETEANKFVSKYDDILDEVDSIKTKYYENLSNVRRSKMRAAIRTEQEGSAIAAAERFARRLEQTESTSSLNSTSSNSKNDTSGQDKKGFSLRKKISRMFPRTSGLEKSSSSKKATLSDSQLALKAAVTEKMENFKKTKQNASAPAMIGLGVKSASTSSLPERMSGRTSGGSDYSISANVNAKRTRRSSVLDSSSSASSGIKQPAVEKPKLPARKVDETAPKNVCLACGGSVDIGVLDPWERFRDSDGNYYHKKCLKCTECNKNLGGGNFYKIDDPVSNSAHLKPDQKMVKIYCSTHYDFIRRPRNNNFLGRASNKPEPKVFQLSKSGNSYTVNSSTSNKNVKNDGNAIMARTPPVNQSKPVMNRKVVTKELTYQKPKRKVSKELTYKSPIKAKNKEEEAHKPTPHRPLYASGRFGKIEPADSLVVTRKRRSSAARLSIGRSVTDSANIKQCPVCEKKINVLSTPKYELHKDNKQQVYHRACLRCEVCETSVVSNYELMQTGERVRVLCPQHYSAITQFEKGTEVTKGTPKESMIHRTSVTQGRNSITLGHLNRVKDEIGDDLEKMFDGVTPLCVKCGLELRNSDLMNVASHGMQQAHAQCPSPEEVALTKQGNIRLIVRKLPKDIPVKFHFNNNQVRTYFFHLDDESFARALKQGQKEDAIVRYNSESEEDVKKRRSMKRPVRFSSDEVAPAFKAELRGDIAKLTKGSVLDNFTVASASENEVGLTAKGSVEQGLIYSLSATCQHSLANGFVFPTHLELEITRANI